MSVGHVMMYVEKLTVATTVLIKRHLQDAYMLSAQCRKLSHIPLPGCTSLNTKGK